MKKRKLVIALIAAVAVIGAAAAAYVFAGEYIVNQFMLMTLDDSEYFKWVSARQVTGFAERYLQGAGETDSAAGGTGSMADSERTADSTADSTASTASASGRRLEGRISLQVGGTLCELLNLYTFKEVSLDLTAAARGGAIGLQLIPGYAGRELVTLALQADTDTKELYAAIPEYSSDLIDLSGLYDTEITADKTLYDVLDAAAQALGRTGGETESSADFTTEAAEELTRYYMYVLDSFREVEVLKNQKVRINGENVRCNIVRVQADAETISNQLTGLANLLCEYGRITASNRDMVLEWLAKLPQSLDCTLDMYVDGRGNTTGCCISADVASTVVTCEAAGYDTEDGRACDIDIEVNSLSALTVRLESDYEGPADYSCAIAVEPGRIVKTLLGKFADYSIVIGCERMNNSQQLQLKVQKGDTQLAGLTVSGSISGYAPVLETSGRNIFDPEDPETSGYLDASRMVELLLDIIDGIGESFVTDYIEDIIYQYTGMEFSVEDIRQLNAEGYFDTLLQSLFGGAAGTDEEPEPEPEPDPVIPGITSLPPEEYEARTWEYPAEDAQYGYSHGYLADYCSPGTVDGVEYAIPLSGEITEEQLSTAQQQFLSGYVGRYTYDQSEITVETGDEVYMDIVPLLLGRPVTAYAYSDCYELIGTDNYGDGLDEKLLGMCVGETRDVEATLNANYGEFAGYSGLFRVTLKQIVRYVVPEWNDEFLCGWLGYASVEDCREELMQQLMSKMEYSEANVTEALMQIVRENAVISQVPEEDMNRLRQEYYDALYDETVQYGMKPEKYYMSQLGYTVDDFIAELDRAAQDTVSQAVFYAALCKAEGLYLTGSELQTLIGQYMDEYGADSFEALMEIITLEEIADTELERRAEKYIFDHAVLSFR